MPTKLKFAELTEQEWREVIRLSSHVGVYTVKLSDVGEWWEELPPPAQKAYLNG